jgi:tetratricopeptide (TPR) repeat protein
LIPIVALIGQVETYVLKQPKVIEVSNAQDDAFYHLDQGNYPLAIEKFNALLEKSPQFKPALVGKGNCFLHLGKYDEALKIFSQLHGKFPNDAYVIESLGDIAFHSSQFDQALEFYAKAQQIVPKKASLYNAQAKTYLCLGDALTASKNAKMALLLNNKKGEIAPFSLILAYFSIAEVAEPIEQNNALRYIERLNLKKEIAWPYPILSFIKGTLKSNELLSYVESEEQEIQAHTYIGLKLRLEGLESAAKKHLEWVKRVNDIQLFETIYAKSIQFKPKA